MSLPKPQAVLFDWDNTLVDTWPTIHRALNMTLDHMQYPQWSLDKVKSNVKRSMRESFPEMFADHWEEAAKHYQQSYRSIHLEHLQILPGAQETLKMLKAKKLFMGVVTNKKSDTLKLELDHLGWRDYFDVLVGAGDAARDKPSCDPAVLALKLYSGAQGEAVWFVGDTAVDLECASGVGATAILFGDHVPQGMTHDGHGFIAHAHDHAQLQKFFTDAG